MLSSRLSRSITSLASRSMHSSSLITPARLASELETNPTSTVCLDSTWHMPNVNVARSGFEEWKSTRIERAGFFNLDIIAEESSLAHMLPSAQAFSEAVSALGVKRDDHVIFYDTHGVFSSPRAWLTFKSYGHEKVSVLDGGLPRWIQEGYPVVDTLSTPSGNKIDYSKLSLDFYATSNDITSFVPTPTPTTSYKLPEQVREIRSYDQMVLNSEISEKAEADLVLDARPAARFTGEAPEPRAGLSSGSIPNSLSLPFATLLSKSTTTPPYTTLLPPEELEKKFISAMGEEEWELVKAGKRTVVGSCGSGMTAAVILLALEELGVSNRTALYDGSWTDYSSRANEGGTGRIVKA